MRQIGLDSPWFFLLVGTAGIPCFAQRNHGAMKQPGRYTTFERQRTRESYRLSYPYSISTRAAFCRFSSSSRGGFHRRIALGDSNTFFAEADKNGPALRNRQANRSASRKSKTPVETNMLGVLWLSGRVVNITLKPGKLRDTALSIDYSVSTAQPKDDPPASVRRKNWKSDSATRNARQIAEEMIAK